MGFLSWIILLPQKKYSRQVKFGLSLTVTGLHQILTDFRVKTRNPSHWCVWLWLLSLHKVFFLAVALLSFFSSLTSAVDVCTNISALVYCKNLFVSEPQCSIINSRGIASYRARSGEVIMTLKSHCHRAVQVLPGPSGCQCWAQHSRFQKVRRG